MRTLLLGVLLTLATGCGPSLVELQAQRDELVRQRATLVKELAPLEAWLGPSMSSQERAMLSIIVDDIRQGELIDVARDNRKAELAIVEQQLERVNGRIRVKTNTDFDPKPKPDVDEDIPRLTLEELNLPAGL